MLENYSDQSPPFSPPVNHPRIVLSYDEPICILLCHIYHGRTGHNEALCMLVLTSEVPGIDSIFLRWTPVDFIALLSALTFCNHRLQDESYQYFRFTIVSLSHPPPPNSSNRDSIYSTFVLLFLHPQYPSIPPQGSASCVFLDYFRQKILCFRFYLLCGLQCFIFSDRI
jgi:hypothetical protein